MKRLLVAVLALVSLTSSVSAQTLCINDRYGRRCYHENIEVPYSPRTRTHVERYYYDEPRRYYRDDYRPRRHRNSDADFLLGLGIGVGAGIIINELGRR